MNREALQRLLAPLAAMPTRDRRLLAALIPAAALGLEFLVAMPTQTKRIQAQAAMAQERQGLEDTRSNEQRQAEQERKLLHSRLGEVKAELAVLGAAKPTGGPLSAVLAQAIDGHGLRLQTLRGLPVEELSIELKSAAGSSAAASGAASGTTEGAAAGATTATAAGSTTAPAVAPEAPTAAEASPKLFRHRIELTLSGPTAQVLQAVEPLAQRLAPLRLHSLALQPGTPGETQATLVLGAIGTEKTWLEL